MARGTGGTIAAAVVVGLVAWFFWTRYGTAVSHGISPVPGDGGLAGSGPQDMPDRIGVIPGYTDVIFQKATPVDPSQFPAPLPPVQPGCTVPLFCGGG